MPAAISEQRVSVLEYDARSSVCLMADASSDVDLGGVEL